MNQIELIATATFGLEAVVARELTQLGYAEHSVEDGRVTFTADEMAICRTNLWLRSADRVLVKMASFPARDFGVLFDQTKALPWSEWLPVDAKFPVSAKSVKSQLFSVPTVQGVVKKAIVESLKQKYQRHQFEESGAEFAIEVSLLRDVATLTLDTSGAGLHKRGYRQQAGAAPLKETLAAGLIQLSYWNRERPFLDPFCGSGTIPIEAVLIARNRAPGMNRSFVAEDWPRLGRPLWRDARTEARDKAIGKLPLRLTASDIDPKSIALARQNAREAGVDLDIHFERKPVSLVSPSAQYGCIVCNPPYGERLGDRAVVEETYRLMAKAFAPLDTWSLYVLTAHPEFERIFNRRADRRRKLYNGRIECTYYQYLGPRPPREEATPL